MEGLPLLDIWRILRRRWWLVLGLPLVTAVFSLLLAASPPRVYQVALAFAIDVPDSSILPGSDEGTRAKVAEAMVDDISRIIGRDVFASAVAERLPEGMSTARAPGEIVGMIASSLSATDRHRIVELTVTGSVPAEAADAADAALGQDLEQIALAVVEELDENAAYWFAFLGEEGVAVTLIDRPDPAYRLPPSLRQRLDLPLRLALALLLALGLVFLLHALDPRLHDPEDAEQAAGAPILARIPRR